MTNEMPQNMDETSDKVSPSNKIWWAIIILAVFFAGSVSIYIWTFGTSISTQHEVWGQFGDYLGGLINPVVGFITIILLIITLNTQRQELALQRDDVRRSADALDAQYKAIQIQSFEQTLFKWFDNYQQKIKEIQFQKDDDAVATAKGLDAIRYFNKKVLTLPAEVKDYFDSDYQSREKWLKIEPGLIEMSFDKTIITLKRNLQIEKYAAISTGIRIIYGLLRWINDNELLKSDLKRKKIYASIIRAQLSEHELRLLFAFGLTPAGSKLAKYANLLGLFDNLSIANSYLVAVLLLSGRNPYSLSAFGDQKITARVIARRRMHTVIRRKPV